MGVGWGRDCAARLEVVLVVFGGVNGGMVSECWEGDVRYVMMM